MIILAIETSCDDTGIAIVKVDKKENFTILSNIVSSQIKIHQKYGGIVPNLAAREHLKNIEPCLKQALKEAKIEPKEIDLMAVTVGPGLIPSLLVGTNFARTLAYVWDKPIIGVNHLEGHIAAAFGIGSTKSLPTARLPARQADLPQGDPAFPAIALLVSGGHTQLVLIKKYGQYKIIGETRDDAAGECFDKVARLLGLGYPGGPVISAEAEKALARRSLGEGGKINLPRPMINQKNYDFSFSGLKTAVLYLTQKNKKELTEETQFPSNYGSPTSIVSEVCAEAQQAIIDVLTEKTIRAVNEYKVKTVILSGGVAANNQLREQLKLKIKNCKLSPPGRSAGGRKIGFLVPPRNLCTDNATMIAMAGYFKNKLSKSSTSWKRIKADANLRLKSW